MSEPALLTKTERLVYLAYTLGEIYQIREDRGDVLPNHLRDAYVSLVHAFKEVADSPIGNALGSLPTVEEMDEVERVLRKAGAWADRFITCPDCGTQIAVTDEDFEASQKAYFTGATESERPHLTCHKCGLRLHLTAKKGGS